MAGEERLMNDASLMMIHQAWTRAVGNADDFRKLADDLDKITQGSIEAYKLRVNISEEKIWELIKAETWILPSEALEWGFATEIITPAETNQAAASAGKALINLVKNYRNAIAASGAIAFPKDKLNEILEEIRALKASHSTQNTQPASMQEPNPEPDSQPAPEPAPEPAPAPQQNKIFNFMAALFR